MGFELVVLGASGTYPTPDAACPGYLLRCEGTDVWLDAGPGTFANLQRHTDFQKLRALVLSHLHPDHIVDFYGFYYGLRYGSTPSEPSGFEVYAPKGTEEHLLKLLSIDRPASFDGYVVFRTVASGSEEKIGPFHFRFLRAVHPVEALAMRIEAGGRTLVYSADSGPSSELVELAEGADMLIAEATMQEAIEELAEIHMTAEEAGELATGAGVGRLVLTHIWPGLDPEVSLAQAAKYFSGEIILASDNLRIEV